VYCQVQRRQVDSRRWCGMQVAEGGDTLSEARGSDGDVVMQEPAPGCAPLARAASAPAAAASAGRDSGGARSGTGAGVPGASAEAAAAGSDVAAAAERSAAVLPHDGEPAAAPAALAAVAGSMAAAAAGVAGPRQGGGQGCAAKLFTPAPGDGASADSLAQARAPPGTARTPVLGVEILGSAPLRAGAAAAALGTCAQASAAAGLTPASLAPWPPVPGARGGSGRAAAPALPAPAGEQSSWAGTAVAAAEAPAQRPGPVLAGSGPAEPAVARAAGDPAAARVCSAPAHADAVSSGARDPEAALALEGSSGPQLRETPLRLSVSGIELDALPGSCAS